MRAKKKKKGQPTRGECSPCLLPVCRALRIDRADAYPVASVPDRAMADPVFFFFFFPIPKQACKKFENNNEVSSRRNDRATQELLPAPVGLKGATCQTVLELWFTVCVACSSNYRPKTLLERFDLLLFDVMDVLGVAMDSVRSVCCAVLGTTW